MDEVDETVSLLRALPGGAELVAWFAGPVAFGDAEVVGLHLDREGPSTLVLRLDHPRGGAAITLVLAGWIDVHLDGFSHQNVVGGLALRRAGERAVRPWERGVGLEPGDLEIELMPCFGANGTIRAGVREVSVKPFARSRA